MLKLPPNFDLGKLSISKLSGIYKLSSTIDNRIYIGSAKNLYNRYYRHNQELKRCAHGNGRLQNFANKYSIESLVFEIVEICEVDKLLEREQYYIDNLNPFFNICKKAGSRLGVKATPETIEKLSKSHKGHVPSLETRKKLSKAGLGRKMSPEHKERLRHINKTRIRTPEELLNMSLVQRGKKMSAETLKKQALLKAKVTPSMAIDIIDLRSKGLSHMKICKVLSIGRRSVFNVLHNNGVYSKEYIYGTT